MKKFFQVLLGAWLTGAVLGGGCFCGLVGTGLLVPRHGPSDDYKFVQSQIVEMQGELEAVAAAAIPMPEGYDEMEGLE